MNPDQMLMILEDFGEAIRHEISECRRCSKLAEEEKTPKSEIFFHTVTETLTRIDNALDYVIKENFSKE